MCELMGLCFNRAVSVRLAFSGLKAASTENPDGWGVAWYDEFGTQLLKEARPADRSALAKSFLEDLGARSRIFVSHIRRATAGAVGYVNTHPFYRRFDQRTWVLAHNGTIDPLQLDEAVSGYRPIGETDSERLFCSLLSWMEGRGSASRSAEIFDSLHQKLQEINRFGELNVTSQ